jgi:cell division protease FtsH
MLLLLSLLVPLFGEAFQIQFRNGIMKISQPILYKKGLLSNYNMMKGEEDNYDSEYKRFIHNYHQSRKRRYFPFSEKYESLLKKSKMKEREENNDLHVDMKEYGYGIDSKEIQKKLEELAEILGGGGDKEMKTPKEYETYKNMDMNAEKLFPGLPLLLEIAKETNEGNETTDSDIYHKEENQKPQNVKIFLNSKNIFGQLNALNSLGLSIEEVEKGERNHREEKKWGRGSIGRSGNEEGDARSKSENFHVIKNHQYNFNNIGGYKNVKDELYQCADILKNYAKYKDFNVRVPKGLLLEGPPGTGKTLFAKCFAGEAKCGFIAVSGSSFQEKYVGVGPTRIRELFKLAKDNKPCIIFIDEIDSVGRARSGDGEASTGERDSTLNALLVELDGFNENSGVFLMGSTNRVDLLDPALIRPGRIDKKIYIGLPDEDTRKEIIDIHINGKPYDDSIIKEDLVDTTNGYSGAQIENILNEAMLHALRYNNTVFNIQDLDIVTNKMIAGYQPNENQLTEEMIHRVCVHEMGHAIMGCLVMHHEKTRKAVINLNSPKTPGYTLFEKGEDQGLHTKEKLFEHLMILVAGRVAEEVVYNISITTGAINDFEEAFKLAANMITSFGMGNTTVIYPSMSEKFKEIIDEEIIKTLQTAYEETKTALLPLSLVILEGGNLLKKNRVIYYKDIMDLLIMHEKLTT